MILGIGTDIVEVVRMAQGIERYGERFAKKILSKSEFSTYQQHVNPAAFLAKRFAAKEAVVKALGCGFRDGISMKDISVSNDALGKPVITLEGKAQGKADNLAAGDILLSLADEKKYAVAYALIMKKL